MRFKWTIRVAKGGWSPAELVSSALTWSNCWWTLTDVHRAVVLGENLRGVFAGLVPEDRIVVVSNGIEPVPLVQC